MRNFLIIISVFFGLTFFTKCTSSIPIDKDKDIEQKSVYIANNIDTNSLNFLKKFSYGAKGKDNYWLRVSADTNLYVCNFKLEGDTSKLSIWRPYKFMQEFPMNFKFDTLIYSQFTFSQVQDKIVAIELDSSKGLTLIKDTSVNSEQFFQDKNPFITFSKLNSIAKKYGFVGSSYSIEIGDFFIFWLSPKFKLLYIPDTLKMDSKFKKYWLDEFKKGKKIKTDWSLINIYAE